MKIFALIFTLALLLSGCPKAPKTHLMILENGEKVVCAHWEQKDCGIEMDGCTGPADSYPCQMARYVGEGDMHEAEIFDEPAK